MRLLLVLGTLHLAWAGRFNKVFPASQIETYTPEAKLVGVIEGRRNIQVDQISPKSVSKVLDAAVDRFLTKMDYIPDFPEDYPNLTNHSEGLEFHILDRIIIQVISHDTRLYHGVDESYEISINKTSTNIRLQSETVFGALRGLETLSQLVEFGWMASPPLPPSNNVFIVRDIPLYLVDSPSYVYRGLMIDTSRHYLPVQLIVDNLDAMAMNKLNVLHWHLTDRQSWPYETKYFPELAERGAFHPKLVYTAADISHIIHEGYLRGIRIIPEVDMPGHIQSIARSHPELLSRCPTPQEPLDPTNPAVYDFVRMVYDDLNSTFPDSFVHVGGDEVSLECWRKSPSIQRWMKDHNITELIDLYEIFETKLLKMVTERQHKVAIVWQEVFNLKLSISQDTIVDVWKGFDTVTLSEATNQSHRVILSGCWYLDHLDKSWNYFYNCNPRDFEGGRKELVIGGHASMWGERVDATNFMERVWPRTSAVAERLWAGDVEISGVNETAANRLDKFRCEMLARGFAVSPLRPGRCAKEISRESGIGAAHGYSTKQKQQINH